MLRRNREGHAVCVLAHVRMLFTAFCDLNIPLHSTGAGDVGRMHRHREQA